VKFIDCDCADQLNDRLIDRFTKKLLDVLSKTVNISLIRIVLNIHNGTVSA
jgi:hypothetical protein